MYLFVNLKRSQGKEQIKKLSLKSTLSGSLSINGEPVRVENINDINIHDFSTFANEQALLPEFKNSIRLKSSPTKPSIDLLSDGFPVKRRSSFVEIAKQVVSMEKVLMSWPRPRTRPRSRHHSSSSEDMNDTENEEDPIKIKSSVNSDSGSTTQSELNPSSSSSKNTTPDKQLAGGGQVTTKAVEHDDVVLSVVSPNNLHEHDGYVKKNQEGGGVDEPTEISALMKNGDGKEASVDPAAPRQRLCPCSCVLL